MTKMISMIPEVDITPELYLYYYPEDRLWTDEDGKEIVNIYTFLSPDHVRVFLHDQVSRSFPVILFGEDLIVNAMYNDFNKI